MSDFVVMYNMLRPVLLPLICHPLERFYEVADVLMSSQDPLSEDLTVLIDELSQYDNLNKTKLITKFRLLARSASLDWMIVRETLAESCRLGYAGFLSAISGMNTVYQIQHSKAFNGNITILGQLVDQFKLQTNQAKQQAEMDRSFSNDLTRQLNSFTKTVAELSEKIDTKTLELSRPSGRKTCSSITPPTADSVSSPQVELPCDIELIPGAQYKSAFLRVDIGSNGDISMSPLTARAKALAELGLLKMSGQGLMTILNQDLSIILGKCTTNTGFSTKFNNCSSREEKIGILQRLFGSVKLVSGQWLRM